MSLNAFLKIKSKNQGDIKGSVTQKGREGSILVLAASHPIMASLGAGGGAGAGKARHEPFKVLKETDCATPLLYKAFLTGEHLTEVRLDFFRPSAGAAGGMMNTQNVYSVKLSNVIIVGIDFNMPHSQKPENRNLWEYEEVSFDYQRIEWTWLEGIVTSVAIDRQP